MSASWLMKRAATEDMQEDSGKGKSFLFLEVCVMSKHLWVTPPRKLDCNAITAQPIGTDFCRLKTFRWRSLSMRPTSMLFLRSYRVRRRWNSGGGIRICMLTEISGLKSPTEGATAMLAAHHLSIQATYCAHAACWTDNDQA